MIYVSYSNKDKTVVEKICYSLKEKGFQLFADYDQLVGVDFARQLTKRIESAEAVILFYSKNAENSGWIRHEIEFSISEGKRIIPVQLSDVASDSWLNYSLGNVNRIKLERNDIEDVVEKITQVIIATILDVDEQPLPTKELNSDIPITQSKQNAPQTKSHWVWLLLIMVISSTFIYFGVFTSSSPRKITQNYGSMEEEVGSVSNSHSEKYYPVLDTTAADSVVCEDYYPTANKEPYSTADSIDEECYASANEEPSHDVNIGARQKLDRKRKHIAPLSKESFSWITVLIAFLSGCFIMSLLLWINKHRRKNIKLSSDIASTVSIDGGLHKELKSREVYSTHLDKGDYLIDFEDKNNKERHQTYTHTVDSYDSKLIFANFETQSANGGKNIKCFIAGSKTLQSERDALRAVTCAMYNKWESKNFRIQSYTFEDFERAAVIGGHQKQYNEFIAKEADWALFIIDGIIGDKTIEEYRTAMDSYKKNGKPKVLAFAKFGSTDNSDVAAIKQEIIRENQYWTDYTDINNLKLLFEISLHWDLTNIYFSKA